MSSAHKAHLRPSWDVNWVNKPVVFSQGPFANQWIRIEIKVEQHPQVGKKYAARERSDARSIGPPIFVSQRLYRVHHQLEQDHAGRLVPPPPGCPETLVDPIEDAHAQHWICLCSLYAIHPPTRERQANRVGQLPMDPHGHRPKADTNPNYTAINGSVAGSRKIPWTPARPYPLTAIPSSSEYWPDAVARARRLFRNGNPSSKFVIPPGIPKVGEEINDEEMAVLEKYLPREDPIFIDVNANMIAQYGAGVREVDAKILENAPPEIRTGGSKRWMVYVFDDLLLIQEGYWVLRFHVVNLNWSLHPAMVHATNAFSVLADCFSHPMAVYSSKEYPGLPPTSELTKHVAAQLKIRHRENLRPSVADPAPPSYNLKPGKKRRSNSGSSVDSSKSNTREKVGSVRELAPEPTAEPTNSSKMIEALVNSAEEAAGAAPREIAKTELWSSDHINSLFASSPITMPVSGQSQRKHSPAWQHPSDSPSPARFTPYPLPNTSSHIQKQEHSPMRRHRIEPHGSRKRSPLVNSFMSPVEQVMPGHSFGSTGGQNQTFMTASPDMDLSGQLHLPVDPRMQRSYSMNGVSTASTSLAPHPNVVFRSASQDCSTPSPTTMPIMPLHPTSLGFAYSQAIHQVSFPAHLEPQQQLPQSMFHLRQQ